MEDTNDKEEVSPYEALSSGHVVNRYWCSQVVSKMNTQKHPRKKNDRYNLRSKGDPLTLEEMQDKGRRLIKKFDPPTASKKQTQSKSKKTASVNNTSITSKLQNNPLDRMSIRSTPNTSVSLPPLDYNIVGDMNKTRVKISLLGLAKVMHQRDILLCALGQTEIDNTTYTNKGACTPPRSLSTVLNTLQNLDGRRKLKFPRIPSFIQSFQLQCPQLFGWFWCSSQCHAGLHC